MKAHQVIIFGAGGHANVVAYTVELCFEIDHLLYVVDDEFTRGDSERNIRNIFSRQQVQQKISKSGAFGCLGAGDNFAREKHFKWFRKNKIICPVLKHPTAIVASDVEVGEGSFINAGSIIQPGATIGKGVIINTGAVVEHNCIVEDFVHIGPNVALGGGCRVGKKSWLGIGSTVNDHVTIGQMSMVASGAVVIDDVPDKVLTAGVPARIKSKWPHE